MTQLAGVGRGTTSKGQGYSLSIDWGRIVKCFLCGKPEHERVLGAIEYLEDGSFAFIEVARCKNHTPKEVQIAVAKRGWLDGDHFIAASKEVADAVRERATAKMDVGKQTETGQGVDEEIRQQGAEGSFRQET